MRNFSFLHLICFLCAERYEPSLLMVAVPSTKISLHISTMLFLRKWIVVTLAEASQDLLITYFCSKMFGRSLIFCDSYDGA